nr:MAG TPA: hypothetical protein [Caudoviricetes sp.]
MKNRLSNKSGKGARASELLVSFSIPFLHKPKGQAE